ncbi:helix-turn-helix transcriptional regulator [Cohnella silvisoli]|uniref:AraC family transcriptional regulator n=1 Tax=Cohnella silvisoli TaxID=2873699 RepID=A0ABV1KLY7_9BACL|nr:AraC family transcriptional regulator [Cohnella silvisoli]MCD9020602.1 AraC family transcriptional regulator [Cohnella silvisoli]
MKAVEVSLYGIILHLNAGRAIMNQPLLINKDITPNESLSSIIERMQSRVEPFDLHMELKPIFDRLILSNAKENMSEVGVLSGPIDTRLIRVNRYISENYDKPITLRLLADLIHCNPVYLSNTYAKVFKISPIKYAQQVKMFKAKEILQHTSQSICDIVNQLGYISSSQFTDLFKRYHGVTPSKFRIMHLNKSNR